MAWKELGRDAERENNEDRGRKIGVYIGVLAVLLAIGSLGGTNSQQEATIKTIEASNVWAFFQAKNVRREVIRAEVDLLELGVLANPNVGDVSRAATAEKIKGLKARDAAMTTDPKSGEGLDELFAKAKSIEAERDIALKRNPYFDFGTAFLSIAIALASVALLTNGVAMLGASGLAAIVGLLATINGYTLLFDVPFIK